MELDDNLDADLLRGVPEIANFTGETERRTYYLLERKLIPAGKMGALWLASKAKLREHYRLIATGGAGA